MFNKNNIIGLGLQVDDMRWVVPTNEHVTAPGNVAYTLPHPGYGFQIYNNSKYDHAQYCTITLPDGTTINLYNPGEYPSENQPPSQYLGSGFLGYLPEGTTVQTTRSEHTINYIKCKYINV